MSNNLVSQPLSISTTQIGQMEHISNKLEKPIPAMQMELMGFIPDNPASQQLPASKSSAGFMGSLSNDFDVQKLSMLETNYRPADGQEKPIVSHQLSMPSRHPEEIITMQNNQGVQQLSVLSKRKSPMEPTSSLSPRSFSMPYKRPTQMLEHRPWLLQQPAANRKIVSGQSMQQHALVSKHLPSQNKKLTQVESISPKSVAQRSAISKNQNASQKGGAESFQSVRAKMRESLAAALALVSQEGSKPPNVGIKSQDDTSIRQGEPAKEQPDPLSAASRDTGNRLHEEPKVTTVEELGDQILPLSSGADASSMVPLPSGPDFQSDNVLSTDDVPFSDHFFVKDELLQGNGLTWVLESDMGMVERLSAQAVEGKELVHEEVSLENKDEKIQSPEDLAFEIEAELFKLFGGVNKKYREKGRSLLFNLKDRSNPDLRERVVSGEIPPDKLCSMTAEELASKELSEWRMAKAEELAQMVVLPDSSVDVRRLVKKTHKGEFQVEVEQDDGVSVEVSLGVSSITRDASITSEKESSITKADEVKESSSRIGESTSNDQEDQCTFTIPSEDQAPDVDIMVEDAIGNLPPIVSLDEFMESLDSEPPFENLRAESGDTESPHKDVQVDPEMTSPKRSPKVADDAVVGEPNKSGEKETLVNSDDEKSNDIHGKSENSLSPVRSKGEEIWQGSLQLNISSTASVIGIFKSGEKTTAKDWSSSLEIKGRVRLDAFEKFLQDLRMSKSRAIMVLHFLCKDGSSESERASVSEVADSYLTDDRVGFAEPRQGVELYFCPPHLRTRELLSKILPEDQIHEALDSVENGLIGVVIWRRTSQFTSADNSTSSHKHNSKKQHYSASKSRLHHQEKPLDANVMSSHPSSRFRPREPVSSFDDKDDDDVPPGFGPPAARDVDDLPEFNFSGGGSGAPGMRAPAGPVHGLPSRAPSHPVEHIRELIHKYGQTGSGPLPGRDLHERRGTGVPVPVPLQPWNDDDDDIPEWQPQGLEHGLNPVHRADVGDIHLAGLQRDQQLYPSLGSVPRQVQHVGSSVHGTPPLSWPTQPQSGVPAPYGQAARQRQPWRQDPPRGRGF